MNQFYVSIIFIGITLIAISLLWIFFDRKKFSDCEKRINKKKEELSAIISDAEDMIEELNKFSDYIVTQMDLKNEELFRSLQNFDERLKQLNKRANEQYVKSEQNLEKEIKNRKTGNVKHGKSDLIVDSLGLRSNQSVGKPAIQPQSVKREREKVIPINSRYNQVLALAQDGLSDTEIAKNLKMGKGEIQLILGINK